ncbi:hypothetical protein AVEN_256670-1 [Araneus ventricosus]|uniref:Uncharacterized protein n=1 Tax=Araneus ventricosus TaxID=182803 RepID=A0A4Y2QIV4_ARAVE|nr:hypothetical protein AVEN_48636-1 [Araneus ventricosus]GBN63241.1 hypothetical protein AVEN_256670-1 [Araneus ventricosus]
MSIFDLTVDKRVFVILKLTEEFSRNILYVNFYHLNFEIFVDDIIPHQPGSISRDLENFILQYLDFSSVSFCGDTPDRGPSRLELA